MENSEKVEEVKQLENNSFKLKMIVTSCIGAILFLIIYFFPSRKKVEGYDDSNVLSEIDELKENLKSEKEIWVSKLNKTEKENLQLKKDIKNGTGKKPKVKPSPSGVITKDIESSGKPDPKES